MTDDDILAWETRKLSAGIRAGRPTSVDVVSACLERIARKDAALHAFVKVFASAALARARAMDAEISNGKYRGPLHGLPVAIKDLADIAGEVTGFGSRCYSDTPATGTARFVQNLEEAGAVIIGKTHTVEFAFGSWGTNHALGTPVNPAVPGHAAPGGSSSGSAVAIAAGMVPLAVGSDTGGSVRIPASLCGVFGMKPSHGIISLDGVAPLSAGLDTIGPLAKDVPGLKFLLDAMRTAAQSSAVGRRPVRFRRVAKADLQPADRDVVDRYETFVGRLCGPTETVEEIKLPLPMVEYQRRCGNLMAFDAYRALHGIIDNPSTPVDPWVRDRILTGQGITDAQQQAAWEGRKNDIVAFLNIFGPDDVLLLPTTPFPTRPVSDIDERQLPMSLFTRLANYLDLTAASLPLWRVGDAPVGAQFVMRRGQDDRLLELLSKNWAH